MSEGDEVDLARFRSAWQRQPIEPSVDGHVAELLASLQRRFGKIQRAVRRRDGLETGTAVLGILLFTTLLVVLDGALVKAGSALITAGLVLIIVQLRRGGLHGSSGRSDVSVADFCARQVEALDRQIALLRSVAWWYLGPVIVGANLFFVGLAGARLVSLAYLVATLLLSLLIYRLNLRAVRITLVPIRQELVAVLRELRKEAE